MRWLVTGKARSPLRMVHGNSLGRREARWRMLGAWPGPPGQPRHPGRSGRCEARATRWSFASAKRLPARGPAASWLSWVSWGSWPPASQWNSLRAAQPQGCGNPCGRIVAGQARSPLARGCCMAIRSEGAKPAGACLVPCQDHQDTQDTQEEVASAKRGLLAGHLQARSGSLLAALPHPGCLGGLGGLGCPQSNGIPCGRPSHWKVAFPLRAAQPLESGNPCGQDSPHGNGCHHKNALDSFDELCDNLIERFGERLCPSSNQSRNCETTPKS